MEKRKIRSCLALFGWMFLYVSLGWAQQRAELAGVVTDATGAVVPGAEVVVIHQQSGVRDSVRSNDAGLYRVYNLQPGTYGIEASRQGFKSFSAPVVLEVGHTTTLDIGLEVGAATEKVTVVGRAEVIEKQSQTVSDFITGTYLQTMPLVVRRGAQLLAISAGVTYQTSETIAYNCPIFSLQGSRPQSQTYYIDGGSATNVRTEQTFLEINPSMEIVSEFRVLENNYDAEFSSAGGVILLNTKAGTNNLHGSLWEFHRQKALDARNFFAVDKTPYHEHVFGAAVGGPIKKDKLHFFGSYEGNRLLSSSTQILTVPTSAERNGDFSQKYNSDGSLRTIYDPYTTQVDANGNVTRTAFAGNIIPPDRISPIGARIAQFWPLPNRPPVDPSGSLNYIGTSREYGRRDAGSYRLDWSKSEKDKFYHRGLMEWSPETLVGPFGSYPGFAERNIVQPAGANYSNPADPSSQIFPTWTRNFVTSWTHLFGATAFNDVRFTYSTRLWGAVTPSAGLGYPKELGIPTPAPAIATLPWANNAPNDHFPTFSVPGYTGLGATGWGAGWYQLPARNIHGADILTWLRGNHSLASGFELRRSAQTIATEGGSGSYTFRSSGTAKNLVDPASGDGLATLLMDWPETGSVRSQGFRTYVTTYLAGFIQDKWRIKPNLMLNLGLRYDYDTPMTESRADLLAGFDPTAINPVCNCPGALTFPKAFNDPQRYHFQPRIGIVWSPGGGNTVIRTAYGLFFGIPYGMSVWNFPGTGRPDVTRAVSLATTDNNLTAPFHLSTGLPEPPAAELTPGYGAVPIGQPPVLSPDFYAPHGPRSYTQMINLGVQHKLPRDVLVEVGGVATFGRHMDRNATGYQTGANLELNQLPPEVLGPGDLQTLRPFPQYNNVSQDSPPVGRSNYRALLLKAEKKSGRGFTFTTNYTWAQFLDDFHPADYYNRKLDLGPSQLRLTHRFVFSGVYEVQAGRGRRYLQTGPLSYVLGDWDISGIFTAQSGQPLDITAPNRTNSFNNTSIRPNLVGDPHGPKTIDDWWNQAAFEDPGPFKFGNAGPGLVDGPGMVVLDSSFGKSFSIGETKALNFRVDMFNALNHANFRNPSTQICAQGVACTTDRITSARPGRSIQLGLRFVF